MKIAETLAAQFDHEMATTRTLLERVPDDAAAWKPHPKSMSMGELASHIAAMPNWLGLIVQRDEVDFAGPAGKELATPKFESTSALVGMFDRNIKSGRSALIAASDEDMRKPWALRNGAHQIISMPRVGVVSGFVLSHMIHHRGQLSVYLRLQDVPLPPIYGPTADS